MNDSRDRLPPSPLVAEDALGSNQKFDNADLQAQFYDSISQLIARRLSPQLPEKMRPVFSLEDLTQEAVMRIARQIQANNELYTPAKITRPLVVAVAQRVLVDAIRKYLARKRMPAGGFVDAQRTSSLNLMNEVCNPAKTPSQLEIHKEFWAVAMGQLNEEERELVELKNVESLEYEEIAAIYGTTSVSIKNRYYRILNKLRSHFSGRSEFESFL